MRLRESGHLTLLQSLVLTPNQLPKEMALTDKHEYLPKATHIRKNAQKYYFLYRFGEVLGPLDETEFKFLGSGLSHLDGARLLSEHTYTGLAAIYAYLHQKKGYELEEASSLSIPALWLAMQKELAAQKLSDDAIKKDRIGFGKAWIQTPQEHDIFQPKGDCIDSDASIQAWCWARQEMYLDYLGYDMAVDDGLASYEEKPRMTGKDYLLFLISQRHPSWPIHKVSQIGHNGIETVLLDRISKQSLKMPFDEKFLNEKLLKAIRPVGL